MAQADIFLKLDGITGESKDDKHKGEIDIQSFSWGVANSGSMSFGGGGGAGKASFQDINITKRADKSTPILMGSCAQGKHIAKGLITIRKAGGKQEEYYKISLEEILISSVTNSSTPDGTPIETVHMNYSKIKFEYKEQNADGTVGGAVQFGYDVKADKPL